MTAFATAAELEEFLGFDFDSDDEDRAEALLERASGEMRGPEAADGPILSTATTEMLDTDGSRTLLLSHRHVTAVTEVKVGGVTLASSAYEWSPVGVLYRVDEPWPCGYGKVQVTYTHGFAEVPPDVKGICLAYAGRLYRNPEGDMQRRRGDGSTAFASSADEAVGLRKSELATLWRYRPDAHGAIG